MKTQPTLILLLLLILFQINSAFATNYTSNSNGDWNNPTTWTPNGIPGIGDEVTIKDSITVTSKIIIDNITINNGAGKLAVLYINSTDSLKVLGNFVAIAQNIGQDVAVHVKNTATLYVMGNMTFTRTADNTKNNKLRIFMYDNSKTYVLGQFFFDYQSASSSETQKDIMTSGNAIFDVTGETKLSVAGGKDLDFYLDGSSQVILRDSVTLLLTGGEETAITADGNAHCQMLKNVYLLNAGGSNHCKLKSGDVGGKMTIHGNLYLQTTGSGNDLKFESKGTGAELHVLGDLHMNAAAQADLLIDLKEAGKFYFGGNLYRQNNFGYLLMTTDAELIFNGTKPQVIPDSKLPSTGTDSLFFGKVSMENTSGAPITLTEDLIVQDTLFLSTGNIQTSPTAMIVLEDNAVISGGSHLAYIDGPIKKIGRTDGNPFFFPLGDGLTYAPIGISDISKDDSKVIARYYGDPPPFGNTNNFEAGVEDIAGNGYWEITKNSKTGDLDITPHWTDAEAQGINDINALIVVGLNGTTWNNYGQESFSGAIGSGASGSITSLYSDPPPFGVIHFTIGSTNNVNKLPVELTKFAAIQQDKQVALTWQTASEVNSSNFIIERSIDGFHFERIGSVDAQGDNNTVFNYFHMDKNPHQGLNYYRLKMVDNDLSFEYSFIEVVKFDKDASLIIYPNPVDKILNIQGNNTFDGETQLEIFNRSGQQVYSGMVDFEEGKFQLSVDNINLESTGTYFIKITNDFGNHVLKFVKVE